MIIYSPNPTFGPNLSEIGDLSCITSCLVLSGLLKYTLFKLATHLGIIAELQRAKRASEAPWVRKIGNPSSRENLVMTSAYERSSFVLRPSVQTLGEGEGRLETSLTVILTGNWWMPSFLGDFCLEKSEKHSFLFAMSTNDRRGWSNVARQGLTEAERERERQRARINRQRCGEEVRERVGHD